MKVPSSPPRIVRSTTRQYAKMPRKMPSTIWVGWSRMKLRKTRGEYWVDVSDSVTIVMENTTPATVIIDVAIAESIAREPAAPAPNSRGRRTPRSMACVLSTATSTMPSAIEATTTSAGTNQKLALRRATSRGRSVGAVRNSKGGGLSVTHLKPSRWPPA
jgi:hypothetical protein